MQCEQKLRELYKHVSFSSPVLHHFFTKPTLVFRQSLLVVVDGASIHQVSVEATCPRGPNQPTGPPQCQRVTYYARSRSLLLLTHSSTFLLPFCFFRFLFFLPSYHAHTCTIPPCAQRWMACSQTTGVAPLVSLSQRSPDPLTFAFFSTFVPSSDHMKTVELWIMKHMEY